MDDVPAWRKVWYVFKDVHADRVLKGVRSNQLGYKPVELTA